MEVQLFTLVLTLNALLQITLQRCLKCLIRNVPLLKLTFKENFTSVLNEYDLKTVNEATRMISNTSTCIDNIIIPSAFQYAFKILPSHYSDHTMQILEIFLSVLQPNDENLTNFLTELSKETWQDIHSGKCLNDKWNIFINIFNLHFRYVKVNVNKTVHTYYQNCCETEKCKRMLDMYYILARYFPEAEVHYKTLKNQYVKLLQKSKSELIKSKIDSADNKSQAMWQIINKLTGKNNPSKLFPEGDLQSNADAINNLFIYHAKNSQNSNNKHIYDENQRLKCIFLRPVTEGEIVAIANKFKNKKSSGPLLFVLFITDHSDALNKNVPYHLISYADDTNIFIEANSIDNLHEASNEQFCNITEWFLSNGFLLNAGKTVCYIQNKAEQHYTYYCHASAKYMYKCTRYK
nr:unnamed protein product [Callosobruchus analis]